MNAREKLNGVYLKGALALSGLIGVAAGSFTLFVVVFVGLVAAGTMSGALRFSGKKR